MKLQGFSLSLLYFQIGLSLASNDKILAEFGKKIILPCRISTNGDAQDIQWNVNGSMLVKYTKMGKLRNKADTQRFNVPSRITNDLEISNVQLADSGTFSCMKADEKLRNEQKFVELIVFIVLAEPSNMLLMSETLKLSVNSYSVIDVSWSKDGKKITDGPNMEVNNITIEQSGDYTCHVKMKGDEKRSSKTINVKGFKPSSSIVYMSGKQPITLPFIFNFKVRDSPLLGDVTVIKGNIKYLSTNKTLHTLTFSPGACWPSNCQQKTNPEDLSLSLNNPKSGFYQMEIVLKIDSREKRLQRAVCVANLTVSTSHNNIVRDSNVTLLCSINCIEKNGRLCWRHANKSYDICGHPGKDNLAKEITILPKTSGNWSCGVFTQEKRLASVNLTLEIYDISSILFWVTIVAGVIVFLLIVIILTITIARHRRMRRARYRAWLLENLHQHRRCECDYKGFAPQRLRQNV